jgi:uncharacterized protein
MKILTVYHGDSCIDGFTSAWLSTIAAKQAGYKEPELYPLTYKKGQEEALNQHIVNMFVVQEYYDIIYILDISLSLEGLKALTRVTKAKIIMLDHHKTAFDRYVPDVARTKKEIASVSLYNGRVDIALNNGISGAGMTYMYFFPYTEAPLLVQHVQDRDIWAFKMENTKAVDLYLKQAEQSIESWTGINAMMCHDVGYREIVKRGQELLDAHESKVLDIAHTSEWVTINKATGLMVRCGHKYASDVGHELAKESGTFGLTYFKMGNASTLQVSLRSEGNYDVEAMAKKLGGGGHKNAAGFIIESDKFFSGELA